MANENEIIVTEEVVTDEKVKKTEKTDVELIIETNTVEYPHAINVVTNVEKLVANTELNKKYKMLSPYDKHGIYNIVYNYMLHADKNIISKDHNGEPKQIDDYRYCSDTKLKNSLYQAFDLCLREFLNTNSKSILHKNNIEKYLTLPSDDKKPQSVVAMFIQGLLTTIAADKKAGIPKGKSISSTSIFKSSLFTSITKVKCIEDDRTFNLGKLNGATKEGGSSIGNMNKNKYSEEDYFCNDITFNISSFGRRKETLYKQIGSYFITESLTDAEIIDLTTIINMMFFKTEKITDSLFTGSTGVTTDCKFLSATYYLYNGKTANKHSFKNSNFGNLKPSEIVNNMLTSNSKTIIFTPDILFKNNKYVTDFYNESTEYMDRIELICGILNDVYIKNSNVVLVTNTYEDYILETEKHLQNNGISSFIH